MVKILLSLRGGGNKARFNAFAAGAAQQKVATQTAPFFGYCAVGFGLLGIFAIGFVFIPLGLAFSIAALHFGQPVWGVSGLFYR